MPNEPIAPAGAAQEQSTEQPVIAVDEQARIDAYTDAVTSGASPETIAKLASEMRAPKGVQEEPPKPAEETPPVETQKPEEVTPTEEQPKPAEVEPPKTPEPGGTPTQEVEGKIDDRVRLNHLGEQDKARANAMFALTRGGMSLEEATRRVMGNLDTPKPADELPTEPETPQHITDLETKLADVRTRIKEAKTGGVLVTPEIDALEDERMTLISQLAVARNAIEAAAGVKQELTDAEFQRTRQGVLNQAVNLFPSMKDRTSTQWLVAKGIGEQMRDPAHPDHARLFQPDAPLFIAQKAAEKLGIKPAGGEIPNLQQTQQTQQTAQVQKPKPGPARGSSQSAPPEPAKTREQRIAESQALVEAVLEGRAKPPVRPDRSFVFLG